MSDLPQRGQRPPELAEQIVIQGQIVPGPNGKPVLAMTIGYGTCTFAMMLTADGATQLAVTLPAFLDEAAGQLRALNTGLHLPNVGGLRLPPNGKPS